MENAAQQQYIQLHHRLPRHSCFETRAGELILRDFCTPSLVESLRIDGGMRAFGRTPAREYQLLLRLAQRSDSVLTLAHTSAGEIVGELSLAPADSWWGENASIYEIGLEVSSGWRQLGIARQLLNFTFALDIVEDMILLAIGLSWHWDTQGTGLHPFRYRALLAHALTAYGFAEYQTAEPNIQMDPANILLVRIGQRVRQEHIRAFFARLLSDYTTL